MNSSKPTYTLPWDCARCKPENPDAFCKRCLRWVDMPEQTFGPRTGIVYGLENSSSSDCLYLDGTT